MNRRNDEIDRIPRKSVGEKPLLMRHTIENRSQTFITHLSFEHVSMATLIAISRTFLLSRLYYSVITFPVSFVQIQCGPLLLQRNFVISGWKGNATKQEMNMCIRGLLYYWILPSGEFHRKWFDKATFEFRLLYFSTKWYSNFSFRKKGNYIQLCVIYWSYICH